MRFPRAWPMWAVQKNRPEERNREDPLRRVDHPRPWDAIGPYILQNLPRKQLEVHQQLEELVWPESKTLVHDMVRNKEMDALASTRSTVFFPPKTGSSPGKSGEKARTSGNSLGYFSAKTGSNVNPGLINCLWIRGLFSPNSHHLIWYLHRTSPNWTAPLIWAIHIADDNMTDN